MPVDRLTVPEALERLTSAARNGNRAKRRLAQKLATMTPTQLRKVNPETFARLGPDGLKIFAAASRSLRGVAPSAQPVQAGKTEPNSNMLRRKWHFAHPVLKCLVAMAVSGVIGVAAAQLSRPLLNLITAPGREMINDWPVCERIDRSATGCIYRTSSNKLTIDKIVAMTGLSPEIVIAWNGHLDFRFTLPPGALVVVPRHTNNP